MESTTGLALLLGLLATVVAVVLVTQRTHLHVKKIAQSSLPPFSFRCPKCGKNMTEGFVKIGGMGWRSFNSSPGRFSASQEKLKNICADQSILLFSLGAPENRALRCTDCSLLIIDHGELFMFKE